MKPRCPHCNAVLKTPGVSFTKTQRQIFDFLRAYKGQEGVSLAELERELKRSRNTIRAHIFCLRLVLKKTPWCISRHPYRLYKVKYLTRKRLLYFRKSTPLPLPRGT